MVETAKQLPGRPGLAWEIPSSEPLVTVAAAPTVATMRCKTTSFYVWGIKVLPHTASVLVDGVWRPVTLHRPEPGSNAVCIHELTAPVPISIRDVGVLELDPARCFGRAGRRVDAEALSLRLAGQKRYRYLEALARTATEPSVLAAVLRNPAAYEPVFTIATARLTQAGRTKLLQDHLDADPDAETTTSRRRLTYSALDALLAGVCSHRPSPERDLLVSRATRHLIAEKIGGTRVQSLLSRCHSPEARAVLLDAFCEYYPLETLRHAKESAAGVVERALRHAASDPTETIRITALPRLFAGWSSLPPADVARIVRHLQSSGALANPVVLVPALAAHLDDPAVNMACHAATNDPFSLRAQAVELAADRPLFEDDWWPTSPWKPRRRPVAQAPECLGRLDPRAREELDPAVVKPQNSFQCRALIGAYGDHATYPSSRDEYAVLVWSHAIAAGTAAHGDRSDWRYLTAALAAEQGKHPTTPELAANIASLGGTTELARMRRSQLLAGVTDPKTLTVFARFDRGRVAVAALKRLGDEELWREVATTSSCAAAAAPVEVLATIDPADTPGNVRAVMLDRGIIDPLAAVTDDDPRVRIAAARRSPDAAARLINDETFHVHYQAVMHTTDADAIPADDRRQVNRTRVDDLLWYDLARGSDDLEVARVAVSRIRDRSLLASLHANPELQEAVAARLLATGSPNDGWYPPVGEHADTNLADF